MSYITKFRKFAISNAPFVHELSERDRRGVFGTEEREQSMLEFEERIEEIHRSREERPPTEGEEADRVSREWAKE